MRWAGILFVLLLILISFGFGYLHARRTLGSKAALRNLKFASIFIVSGVLIGIVINKGIPESWEISPFYIWAFICIMPVWFLYFRWFWLTKRAGKTLLNLKRLKYDNWSLVAGIGGIFLGLSDLGIFIEPNEPTPESKQWIIYLSLGVVMLISGLIGTRILEKGITSMGRFMAWNNIESYGWESDKSNTLTVKLKNRIPLFRTLSLPIPPGSKEEVDRLLKENIPRMI